MTANEKQEDIHTESTSMREFYFSCKRYLVLVSHHWVILILWHVEYI